MAAGRPCQGQGGRQALGRRTRHAGEVHGGEGGVDRATARRSVGMALCRAEFVQQMKSIQEAVDNLPLRGKCSGNYAHRQWLWTFVELQRGRADEQQPTAANGRWARGGSGSSYPSAPSAAGSVSGLSSARRRLRLSSPPTDFHEPRTEWRVCQP